MNLSCVRCGKSNPRYGLPVCGPECGKLSLDNASGNLEQLTLENNDYRRVLYTTQQLQLVLMCIQPGGGIPREIHPFTTQFFRVEAGRGELRLAHGHNVRLEPGSFAIVPPNTEHEVLAFSAEPLRLYTVYSPPQHPAEKSSIYA
jgi:mannose-6-phosphate isomerase-like protein (cupin superfamily)